MGIIRGRAGLQLPTDRTAAAAEKTAAGGGACPSGTQGVGAQGSELQSRGAGQEALWKPQNTRGRAHAANRGVSYMEEEGRCIVLLLRPVYDTID